MKEIISCCSESKPVSPCSCSQTQPLSDERPGYALYPFVEKFIQTSCGSIPKIRTALEKDDHIGAFLTRLGIGRNSYTITPGLYCVGMPDEKSPVLVTANYKLTFDALRKELSSVNAWILVLNTKGINVWCAAGKGSFSSDEVCRQVHASGLERIVSHKELILPQLSAVGVSAIKVKQGCGFKVIWGPVYAKDIPQFLENSMKADAAMRKVTFSLRERFVLIPIEFTLLFKKTMLWILPAIFLLSGIGAGITFAEAFSRTMMILAALFVGIIAGTAVTPILLPYIPSKSFSVKGAIIGSIFGLLIMLRYYYEAGIIGALALILLSIAAGSYMAMNFTGSTPFTSPSGVEKEMRQAIPFQAGATVLASVLWIISGFIR